MPNATIHGVYLTDFLLGYVEAALWSTNDESDESGGKPLDTNYRAEDIHPDTLRRMAADCEQFAQLADGYIDGAYIGNAPNSDEEMAGHFFWLNRNGHGRTFKDGDWTEAVEIHLYDLSKKFGEYDLHVGDDGMIHGTGGREPDTISAEG